MYPKMQTNPSIKLNVPSKLIMRISIVEAISSGMLKLISSKLFFISFVMITDAPKTSNIFAIFEPTTFPTTISDDLWITASIDDASSGSEVPILTMVTPIINGLILKNKPIFSAAVVKKSALLTRIMILTISIIIQSIIVIILVLLTSCSFY